MTGVQDKGAAKPANLPEPPFDELYELYIRALAYDRRRWIDRTADDPHLEERVAMIFQPKSKERFRAYLEECTARGSRTWAVNCLVLGPEFCDAHPDDPRIALPPGEVRDEREQIQKSWCRAISGADLPAGGGRLRP